MEESSLTKTARFIKAEKYLFILGAISFIVFIIYISSKFSLTEPASTTWKEGIVPGETSASELVKKLGEPTKKEVVNNKNVYYYETDSQYRPNKIEIEKEKVKIIKEEVIAKEEGILQDYISKYGKPESVVYGKQLEVAPGHFWGSQGIMVFANDQTGLIFEIWYFAPTKLDALLSENSELRKNLPNRI